jgi:hypothetical protein
MSIVSVGSVLSILGYRAIRNRSRRDKGSAALSGRREKLNGVMVDRHGDGH